MHGHLETFKEVAAGADGNLVVAGALSVGDALNVAGVSNLSGDLTLLGAARLYGLKFQASTHADSTATVDRNAFTVAVNSGAAAYIWTIFGTNQQDGDWCGVRCNTTNNCTLKDPAGNTLLVLNGGGVQSVCCLAVRIAGNWVVALSG